MAQIDFFTYNKKDTIIHSTHPTLKIILIALLSITLTRGTIFELMYSISIIVIAYFVSLIPLKSLVKEFRYILFLISSLTVFQFLLGGLDIIEALSSAAYYGLRITGLITLGSIFINTTKPQEITPGVYNIIRSKQISEFISLTIKLIPTFIIGWSHVDESLKSRGLYLSKNPFRIMKHLSIPLLVETFKRANSISISMESRGYNGWIKTDIENKRLPIFLVIPVIIPYLLQIKMLLLQG